MNPDDLNTPVDPLLLAKKLKRALECELPEFAIELADQSRRRETLWFIQWASRPENYPGGLSRFASELIDDSQDLIGSTRMNAHPADAILSESEIEEIVMALPDSVRHELPGFDELAEPMMSLWVSSAPTAEDITPLSYDGFPVHESRESRAHRLAEAERRREVARNSAARLSEERAAFIRQTSLPQLVNLCSNVARERLGIYLKRLCERDEVGFTRDTYGGRRTRGLAPWYFAQISTALIRFMDRWADRQRASIAQTSTTREISEWLNWAREKKRSVMFQGETRQGKTEALAAWCRTRPGAARFIRTPPESGGLAEFLRWIARELGLDFKPNANAQALRPKIEFVLRYSGLVCGFDEFQYAFPAPSSNRSPDRLNFVRAYLMDAGVPCAFVCTEQGYSGARNRYVKATGYVIAQFEERLRTIKLPEEVSSDDLSAIARFHLPQLNDKLIELVVKMAIDSRRGYVSDLRKIADDVERIALANGAAVATTEHVLKAIDSIYPGRLEQLSGAQPAPAPIAGKEPRRPRAASGRRSAGPLQAPCRGVAPLPVESRFESQQGSSEPIETTT